MFLFKKILAPFLYPLSLGLEILLLGVILLWWSRRQRLAKVLITVGVSFLILCSYGAFPNFLLQPLERLFPPVMDLASLQQRQQDPRTAIRWIVVLGGGHLPDPQLPVTSQMNEASLLRVVEGIRLYRALPGSKLLLSGGSVFTSRPEAETLAEMARTLGVPEQDLLLESGSRDTREQALLLKSMLQKARFLLVTSAWHMPRSVALFQKIGLHPIPAPTGHLVRQRQGSDPARFFPGSDNLYKTYLAWHEYLGLAWEKLRGEI